MGPLLMIPRSLQSTGHPPPTVRWSSSARAEATEVLLLAPRATGSPGGSTNTESLAWYCVIAFRGEDPLFRSWIYSERSGWCARADPRIGVAIPDGLVSWGFPLAGILRPLRSPFLMKVTRSHSLRADGSVPDPISACSFIQ